MENPHNNNNNNKSDITKDVDELVPLLISKMNWIKDEFILDYGCGIGSTTKTYIIPQAEIYNLNIIGVDHSKEMIECAQIYFSHPRITYKIGNIMDNVGDNFSFSSHEFKYGHIFSIFVFHFIKDYGVALMKLKKLLKPGGQFGFLVLTQSVLFSATEYIGKHETWKTYMNGYENQIPEWIEKKYEAEICFRKIIKSLQYKILEIRSFTRGHEDVPVDTLAELFMSLNPLVNKIPEIMLPALKEEYIKYLINSCKYMPNLRTIEINNEILFGLIENSNPE